MTLNLDRAHSEAIGRYALGSLQRLRDTIVQALPADDLAALNRLLDTDRPHSILRRNDLAVRTERTVCAAANHPHVAGQPTGWGCWRARPRRTGARMPLPTPVACDTVRDTKPRRKLRVQEAFAARAAGKGAGRWPGRSCEASF